MTRFAALLRGINVNGITIAMNDLRGTFEGLGHTGARTVLASGNVLFDTDRTDAAAIKAQIERALSDTFGYQAWIVLIDTGSLARVVRDYPFDPGREGWHPYVVFGTAPAVLGELAAEAPGLDPAIERVVAGDGVLYWQVLRSVGITSPFSRMTGKARYRSTTTTRNLRTLDKLLGAPPAG
ncbi:DUF1697 domain-containing protein [Cryobacterium fucosi]|uniref:DUF1697 domain-containing protein n=1 Tax=Cryobacterium fucosi TaxID=1259157 RepID=A0A4R9AWH0_9MICO|nr:DUF1697 domain-containing protein [Cryobacterium fucosi]TFD71061.1 DUF1697 domain-containing protein [Cryobacterium fucosi]